MAWLFLRAGDLPFEPGDLRPGALQVAANASRAAAIDYNRALPRVAPGTPVASSAWNYSPGAASESPSTSHLSVVDRTGDAVAMTTSVQSSFGSQLMVGGFLLNNQLTDFDYVPEERGKPVANRIEGGKRPLSSMAPMLVFDDQGRLRLMIGSPGGTRIINYVVQVLVGVLDWEMDVQQAVAAPHFLAQQALVELEEGTALVDEPTARREGSAAARVDAYDERHRLRDSRGARPRPPRCHRRGGRRHGDDQQNDEPPDDRRTACHALIHGPDRARAR